LSKKNIRVSVPAKFTFAIGNKPGLMISAAERLLDLNQYSIRNLAHDIIHSQIRLVITNTDIEELNVDNDKFVKSVNEKIENEINKIGLQLINVHIKDVKVNVLNAE